MDKCQKTVDYKYMLPSFFPSHFHSKSVLQLDQFKPFTRQTLFMHSIRMRRSDFKTMKKKPNYSATLSTSFLVPTPQLRLPAQKVVLTIKPLTG